MVTLMDYVNAVNGFRCNRYGYKWLHWLQAKNRYNIRAKQGHLHSPYDPFFVLFLKTVIIKLDKFHGVISRYDPFFIYGINI